MRWLRVGLLAGLLSAPLGAQAPHEAYRFPWPPSRPAPSVAGVTVGDSLAQVVRSLGTADLSIEVGASGLRVYLYRQGRLKVALDGAGVESIVAERPESIEVDSIAVGAPGLRALDRWGEPARLDRETGAAVWAGTGWELHAYLGSDGQTLHALELRRPRSPAATPDRAP